MLAEWGIGEFPESGNKASWISEAFQTMKTRFPRLKAAVYWNERWQNDDGTYSNLRVTSSETALEAYRKGVGDSFWVDRPTYRQSRVPAPRWCARTRPPLRPAGPLISNGLATAQHSR